MRRVRKTAVLLAALTIALVTWGAPSGASPPANHQPQITVRNLRVVDGNGQPIPAVKGADSGVLACLPTAPPCAIGFADANGRVRLDVNPTLKYHVFGFARNTGWCNGYELDGALWYFSANSIDVSGGQLARPNTFVVAQPNCITMHILDPSGEPYPAGWGTSGPRAGMRICPVDNCIDQGPNANVVYPGADANGDVVVAGLDPATQFTFLAMAVNIGGCPPYYTDPINGDHYWFPAGNQTVGTPSDLAGTTFSIDEHCS
jgi:hypothetical protein